MKKALLINVVALLGLVGAACATEAGAQAPDPGTPVVITSGTFGTTSGDDSALPEYVPLDLRKYDSVHVLANITTVCKVDLVKRFSDGSTELIAKEYGTGNESFTAHYTVPMLDVELRLWKASVASALCEYEVIGDLSD